MKSFLPLMMLACGAALVSLPSGCNRTTTAEIQDDREAATASEPAADRVTADHPQRKTLELYTAQPGRIEAFEATPLYPKIAGYVEQVLVDIGDSVQKGDTLVKLWVPEKLDEVEQKSALLAQAQAEVGQAEAAVKAAVTAVESAAAQVNQARAGITRANGEHERWQAEHARLRQLAASGSVTQKLVEEALSQFRAAEAYQQEAAARLESAQAAFKESEVNVTKAEADQKAAEARVRVAQADLAQANTMLDYTEIKAPFDGVVTQRSVDTGHYVQPANGSAQALLVVVRVDEVRVFVDVPEGEAALVDCGANGDDATVRVPALEGREFQAQVTRSSWSLDPANRSLRIEIDIPNESRILRPGMYATASILLDRRKDVLVLPITAIVQDQRETFCCCVVGGKIDRRKIELGLRSGGEVEVISGVSADDTIVLVGAEGLQPGQAVEVRTPEA